MKTIKVYSYNELSKESKERALQDWNDENREIVWAEEIYKSFQEIFQQTVGLKLGNYSIGAYQHSWATVVFEHNEVKDFKGHRAITWIENNLLDHLRISYYGDRRKEVSKYGQWYRPGMIEPCPFTGYCFDDTLLNALQQSVKDGDTLEETFKGLANVVQKELEGEHEYQQSEEYFKDHAEANDYQFLENGMLI
jgi:hypothetical protein